MPRREGAFIVEDYFANQGGLNTSDSPFLVQPGESTGGQNYDLQVPGAIRKRSGHLRLNSSANTQLKSLGFGLWNKPDTTRQPVRCAGTKWQALDPSAYTFTNLYEDTARSSMGTATITIASPGVVSFTAHGLDVTDPVQFTTTGALPTGLSINTTYYVKTVVDANSFTLSATAGGSVINTSGTQSGTHTLYKFNASFLTNGSTQPVVYSMFNQPSSGVLWGAGGGMSTLYGAYSATKVTANGVPAPTVSGFTAADDGAATATGLSGKYYYTLVYRKTSTQALSNALASTSDATVTLTANHGANLSWTLTNNDTTKYDKVYIYRSSVDGVAGFTAGSLIGTVDSSVSTFHDQGVNNSPADISSQNVPRANNTILDNSVLPSGTFRCLTTFKRRLVTAYGSTVVFSDVNKPESWPTYQTITVPSGGEITALGIVSLTSPLSTDTDEALVVFKQSETWVITGDGVISGVIPNWTLKFLSSSGTEGQAQVVQAEGYLCWVNYKGFYMWNGAGKPVRISRKIWDKFQLTGDIDKSKLNIAFGIYSQRRNEVIWYLSSATYGEQYYGLSLDITHTISKEASDSIGTVDMEGVFLPDVLAVPMYAGMSFLLSASSTEETIYFGDASGYVYSGFSSTGAVDGNTDITFKYPTGYLNCGSPNAAKRFHKVVAWVQDNGVYNLTLKYWADYRYTDADASSLVLASDPNPTTGNGIWDSGKWDQMLWDSAPNKPRKITYNLSPSKNNTEGDAIRLEFSQTGHAETPIIYGFSVYYSELPLR
jgi:hypothetical protein